ncbi:hypothetical protein MKQ70_34955 [Chitinophaga sedimenti]|uniref:hypothetical protein n=1 Tax=Chitinophaga sedimenti TaxID=2033606 RepID=UPI002005403D|nr:hypothetical protein [Chitinophaga sedimenti]MCK7559860.1 hypothetical protein [Chitinophaga sedimenti]
MKVTQTGWPDYVFDSAYVLPSLQHTADFIKQHKHLPGVTPAAEVEKQGLDIGATQAQLLEKIEQLTLYLIEQEKKLATQQSRIDELEKRSGKTKAPGTVVPGFFNIVCGCYIHFTFCSRGMVRLPGARVTSE